MKEDTPYAASNLFHELLRVEGQVNKAANTVFLSQYLFYNLGRSQGTLPRTGACARTAEVIDDCFNERLVHMGRIGQIELLNFTASNQLHRARPKESHRHMPFRAIYGYRLFFVASCIREDTAG